MKSYYVGYKFSEKGLKHVAKWCNEDGTCHVEESDDGMLIVVENRTVDDENGPVFDSEPSLEDRIKELEERNEFLEECLIELANIIYA